MRASAFAINPRQRCWKPVKRHRDFRCPDRDGHECYTPTVIQNAIAKAEDRA